MEVQSAMLCNSCRQLYRGPAVVSRIGYGKEPVIRRMAGLNRNPDVEW
jgi:hypothetical protein